MKLYTWGRAPNPRRVLIFIAEKGIEIPVEDAGEGAALKGEFLDGGPHRLVPMLELDDGTRIGEAMAICRYLEATHPEPNLFGSTPVELATIEMWERKCEAEGILAAGEAFRNAVPFMVDRGLPGYSVAIPQIPELIERGRVRFTEFARKLDAQLAKHEFIAGDRFTVADITALCAVDFAEKARLGLPTDTERLHAWRARVSARPSTQV